MSSIERLVVIGTGCGGVELAFAARAAGWNGPITLVGEENALPYHRPPLSKAYLMGEANADALWLRAPALFEKQNIALLTAVKVAAIDRRRMQVSLSDGRNLGYDRLVLATGGRPRPLPAAAGSAENFRYLRTLADAAAIRGHFAPGHRLVVVGGGYVGLEVAAAAVKSGMRVTVLEAAPRLLARVTALPLSNFYEDVHRQAGVDIQTSAQVEEFELSADRSKITAVRCAGGARIEADFVVAGIGLIPNCELAIEAGLQVDDGIVVDAQMQTTDEAIMAVGDCTKFYSDLYKRKVRIESVPNALEQARKIAALICGKVPRKDAAPWFWSDQYDLNLKMVGLSHGYDQLVFRGSLESRNFSAFYMLDGRVLAVDTVNRPVEFNLSKQLVLDCLRVLPEALADDTVPLKSILDSSIQPEQI
ncbi:NAD(P)/FAD-dependent oxidoreductase [Noviherbaspirillum sedimenti]|uniref:Pyridine nucleotide-disulfide oxidoreductase n=1 Tax=Noviherbaspirillum sedimenti TaxID=2320865 RepID=A0A3A3G7K8_9BURK|nr:FAD-dependent oxidoreductase [Noviherbaspirillum sedimenti]RJG04497.1 pyridine nucleotide-disulfide oxidoreductase [Noviherbaspirillum sedimenti]